MSELLRECRLALDDWINTYAPDMCDPMHVAQAYERIANGGGTLAYIATLRQRISAALAAPEAEAVREACAKVCEEQADRFNQSSPLDGNKQYAAIECAKAIRALKVG